MNGHLFLTSILLLAFIFDAVLSMGIGACKAEKQSDGSISSVDHVLGIREAVFTGASGQVQFGRTALERGGVRPVYTTSWSAVNFISFDPHLIQGVSYYFVNEAVEEEQKIVFTDKLPFVYSGNTTIPVSSTHSFVAALANEKSNLTQITVIPAISSTYSG